MGPSCPRLCSTGPVRAFWEEHHRSIGTSVAALCFVLALVWLEVVPSEAEEATGLAAPVLRYGHSLVWVLLGVTALLAGWGAPRRLWQRSVCAAGVVYAAFVIALVA